MHKRTDHPVKLTTTVSAECKALVVKLAEHLSQKSQAKGEPALTMRHVIERAVRDLARKEKVR